MTRSVFVLTVLGLVLAGPVSAQRGRAWSGTVHYRVEPVMVPSTHARHVPDSVVLATDGKVFRIDEWFRGEPRVWLLPGDGTARVFFRFVGVPVELREPCEVTGRVGQVEPAWGEAPCVWGGEAMPREVTWGDGVLYRLTAERAEPGRLPADRFTPPPGHQTVDRAGLETLLLTLSARN